MTKDHLIAVGKELAKDYGPSLKDKPESEWLPIVRNRAIDMMMAEIRNDLMSLGVVQNVFFLERLLIEGNGDQVGDTTKSLEAKGEVYVGRLPPPKSGNVEDWRSRADFVLLKFVWRRRRSSAAEAPTRYAISPPTSPITNRKSIAAFST